MLYLQSFCKGQVLHFGLRAVQVLRPWKMIWRWRSDQYFFGMRALICRSVLARFVPELAKPSLLQTRCMWVSTGKAGILNHWLWITCAVFGPTPGRDVRALKSEGTISDFLLFLRAFAQPMMEAVFWL